MKINDILRRSKLIIKNVLVRSRSVICWVVSRARRTHPIFIRELLRKNRSAKLLNIIKGENTHCLRNGIILDCLQCRFHLNRNSMRPELLGRSVFISDKIGFLTPREGVLSASRRVFFAREQRSIDADELLTSSLSDCRALSLGNLY